MHKTKNIWKRLILLFCMLFIVLFVVVLHNGFQYVSQKLLQSNENTAIDIALMVKNNFKITDAEVAYMKTLTFNEMETDKINQRLMDVGNGVALKSEVKNVYLLAPLKDEEIKYQTTKEVSEFLGYPEGTKLNGIWLLNGRIGKDGKFVVAQRDDIYRYTHLDKAQLAHMKEKKDYGEISADAWGRFVTGYVPIYTVEGNFVGFLGIDIDPDHYQEAAFTITMVMIVILFAVILCMSILFLCFYRKHMNATIRQNAEKEERYKKQLKAMADVDAENLIDKGRHNLTQNGTIFYLAKREGNLGIHDDISYDEAIAVLASRAVEPDKIKEIKDRLDRETLLGQYKLGQHDGSVEYQRDMGSGQLSWVLTRYTLFEEPTSEDVIIFLYSYDVTESHEKEKAQLAQVEAALDKAQKASSAKTEFFSRLSHDMRTPMNGILGLIDLSEEETNQEVLQENIAKMKSSGTYLLGLINDSLDFQKIESGRMSLKLEEIYAQDLLENISSMIKETAKEKNIALNIQIINENLDCYVCMDPMRTKQIFVNLLTNALKFTPEGGNVDICVECTKREGMISHNRFTIRDTGIGMSKEFLEDGIFKPFSQESNEVTANYAGTGLGLSIVKKLVELMGGTISVQSKKNVGTTFVVEIDIKRVNATEVSKEEIIENNQKNISIEQLSGKHVLVAEDHPLNAEIIKKLLEKADCIVTIAKNGKECVEMFNATEEFYYDVILMDIRMPVMDGFEAAREIRACSRKDALQIPIVAVTANAYAEDVSHALEAGMNAHLPKPVDSKVLYETIVQVIESTQG